MFFEAKAPNKIFLDQMCLHYFKYNIPNSFSLDILVKRYKE